MTRTSRALLLLLAVVFGLGGLATLAGADAIRDSWETLGVGDGLGTLIGVLEVLAAVGLLVGLRRPAVGAAAAAGLVALMLGAVVYHVRAEDWAGLGGPVVLGLLAALAVRRTLPLLERRPAATAGGAPA